MGNFQSELEKLVEQKEEEISSHKSKIEIIQMELNSKESIIEQLREENE